MIASQLARAGRFLRSPLFPIFMIVFVDVLGAGITLPVLPLYAQNEMGATAMQVALLTSAYFAAQFLASPYLGRLSDRVGRRPVLVLSQSGTFASLLMSGAARALPMLYLARVVDGLTGGNISVAQAYLSDITDERDRARGIGMVNAAFSSGFIFGPAFGGLAAATFGPRVPFYIAAGVSLLTVSLSYFLLPESLTPERRARDEAARAGRKQTTRAELARRPGVALILAIGFGSQLAFFHFQSTWVLWADKVPLAGYDDRFVQQAIGAMLTLVGVCGIATQFWLVGPLVRRFGERAMVAGGLFARGVAWTAMSVSSSIPLMLVVLPLIPTGNGVAMPALIALLTYAAPPGQRGLAIGTMESVQGLGRILGPVLAGLLFQRVGPDSPLAVAALVSLFTIAGARGLWKMHITKAPDRADPSRPG